MMGSNNNSNINNYIYNKNENTVKFFKNFEWSHSLQPFDSFLSPLYVLSSFVFKYNSIECDKINIDRFLDALNQTFESFYFMLSTYKKDENGKVIACYKPNDEEFKRDILEIEYCEEESIDDIKDYNSTLPYKIVSDIVKADCLSDLTGQGLLFLKLTIQKDGFIIGYRFNHGIFDHSSIYYFIKYLSNCYTYGSCNGLKEPYLADSLKFLNEKLKFKDLNEAVQYHEDNLGYGNYFKKEDRPIDKLLTENSVIQLVFNVKNLNQFKGNHIISRNDIITSCLLKILTFTPLLKDEDIFNLKYVCNYRKFLNYDESAIGNFGMNKTHKFTIKDIRSMSVLELSLNNRNIVLKTNENDFKNAITWFKYTQDRNENCLQYPGCLSFYHTLISNWTSFNYETIQFGNTKTKSLVVPSIFATFGMNVVSFENNSGGDVITFNVSVPKDSIGKILEFGKSTNLFTINN